MNTGPKDGLYRKMLGRKVRSKAPPRPKKKWRELSAIENSRLRGMRVLWFRKHQALEFQRLGKWVSTLR